MSGLPSFDFCGCAQKCEDYCKPAIDSLLSDGEKILYIVILMAVMMTVLAWQLWHYKKLYYDLINKENKK